MKSTRVYKMSMPQYSDPIDVDVLSENFETIDYALEATQVMKTRVSNTISEKCILPYFRIRNNNDFDVTVTDRNFSVDYVIEAGKSKRFDVQTVNRDMNFYVQGLHDVTFEWFVSVADALKEGGGGSGGTSNYNDLTNKPKINGAELSGNVTLATLGIKGAAEKDVDTAGTSVTSESTNVPTSAAVVAYVTSKIGELPKPMQIKGTLGTASGAKSSLDPAAEANTGWLYIVVTDGTYASQAAVIGDMFVSNGSKWLYVPSGNELFDGRNIILTEYAKGSVKPDSIAILATDSVNEALKKIEWALDDKVNKTTTINGKTLSSNVTLSGNDEKLNATSYSKDTEAKEITKDTKIDEAVAQLEYRVDKKVNKTEVVATDETEISTRTVPAGCTAAMVAKIKGKTQKVVQIAGSSTYNANNCKITTDASEKITIAATNTAAIVYSQLSNKAGTAYATSIKDHWYYVRAFGFSPSSNMYIYNDSAGVVLTSGATSVVAQATDAKSFFLRIAAGQTVNATIQIMVLDLTAMGLASKTKAELDAMFPSYIPYTEGELWNAPVESVVSQSRNLIDKNLMADAASSLKTIQIKAKANTTYSVLATCPQASDASANFFAYNSSGSPATGTNGVWNGRTRTVTTSADGIIVIGYRLAGFTPATASYLLSFDYCIVEGSTAVNVPYNKTTVLVPSSVKNLPDYGLGIVKSDGTIVANEVDFENGVYRRRVASVDMSNMVWTKNTAGTPLYYADAPTGAKTDGEAVCSKFTIVKGKAPDATGQLRVNEPTYKKSYLYTGDNTMGRPEVAEYCKGVMLVYELAQEETKPLSDYIRPLPVEAGGTLTLVNEHNLDVANVVKYKKEV